jgi:hypothetical protein
VSVSIAPSAGTPAQSDKTIVHIEFGDVDDQRATKPLDPKIQLTLGAKVTTRVLLHVLRDEVAEGGHRDSVFSLR